MQWPYFKYGCSLELNSLRTATYVRNVTSVYPDGFAHYINLSCDCAPLNYYFDDSCVSHAATYTNPISDAAPWYDADINESGHFLGFLIEDVNVGTVATRTSTTNVTRLGGGSIGGVRYKERRMDFTVLMFGCNDLALEYGFRYLTDSLTNGGCDTGCGTDCGGTSGDECALCSAEYRESCTSVDVGNLAASLSKGRWILKNVGLVDGPSWGDPPIAQATCNIRRVTFSLVSEIPWRFKCPVAECTDVALPTYPTLEADCSNWTDMMCGDTQEISCSVTETLAVGETGLIISVSAGSVPLQHIQIDIRPDVSGYECNPETRPVDYVRVDPYDSIVIPEIPAGSTITYDTSIGDIWLTTSNGSIEDGAPYIDTDIGMAPTYPTLRCGPFCVSISVSECSVIGSPTVTIQSVHREI